MAQKRETRKKANSYYLFSRRLAFSVHGIHINQGGMSPSKRKNRVKMAGLLPLLLLFALTVEPVLGHLDDGYSHDDSTGINNPNWMADLPNSARISELSIPGTHDTMSIAPIPTLPTLDGGVITETQSMPLSVQLNSGIRAFDIRLRQVAMGLFLHHR